MSALEEFNQILTSSVGFFGGNTMTSKEDPSKDPLAEEDEKKAPGKDGEKPADAKAKAAEEEEVETAFEVADREAKVAYSTMLANSNKITKYAASLAAALPDGPKLEKELFAALKPLTVNLLATKNAVKRMGAKNPALIFPSVVVRGFSDTLDAMFKGLRLGFAKNKPGKEPPEEKEEKTPLYQKARNLIQRLTKGLRQGAPGLPAGEDAPEEPNAEQQLAMRSKQQQSRYLALQRDMTAMLKLVRANFKLAVGFADDDLKMSGAPKGLFNKLRGKETPSLATLLGKVGRSATVAGRALLALTKKSPSPVFDLFFEGVGNTFLAVNTYLKPALADMNELVKNIRQIDAPKPGNSEMELGSEDIQAAPTQEEALHQKAEQARKLHEQKPRQEDVLGDKAMEAYRQQTLKRERQARLKVAALKRNRGVS